jgi:WD40 repeat protein
VLVAKDDGCIGLVDFRASNSAYQWNCEVQDAKVNSVQQHPSQEHYVVTAGVGQRGCINIHDMRKLMSSSKHSPIVTQNPHSKSVNAAYISPDGESLVSVSLDNTIRTSRNFMAKSGITSLVTRHDNHTGRWLSTFKPTFDPKQPQAFVMGSMSQPRGVDIFHIGRSSGDNGTGAFPVELVHTFRSPYLGSVCSRNDFHPTMDILACGNSSGRVHLLR